MAYRRLLIKDDAIRDGSRMFQWFLGSISYKFSVLKISENKWFVIRGLRIVFLVYQSDEKRLPKLIEMYSLHQTKHVRTFSVLITLYLCFQLRKQL